MKKFVGILGLLLVMGASHAMASGEALYSEKGCAGCHGANGEGNGDAGWPKVSGQHSDYTLAQAKAIRDGKRTSGQAAVMKGSVAGVTDAELKEIADFLASK